MFAEPIEEIANLRRNTYSIPAQSLPDGQSRSTTASGMLFDIRAEFEVGNAKKVVISGNGLKITYDAINKTLLNCPLEPLDGKIRIQAVVDNSLMEIAGNDGRIIIHHWHGHSIEVDEIKNHSTWRRCPFDQLGRPRTQEHLERIVKKVDNYARYSQQQGCMQ